MVVQHNMQAMNANRMLNVTTSAQSKSTEKLSSGYKINRAADDAAGLTISEKMRKQIKGLDRASTNAQDGVSAVQTAEGALTEVHSMLQRMNELAVQASNGTNSESDRDAIQAEIDQLTTEIDRVAETTKFNETYLLKGGEGTKTQYLQAHDAGIKGELTDGEKEAIFKISLAENSKVEIAGKEYTIVKENTDEDESTITADEAASMIDKELTAANNIGATTKKATVTHESNAQRVTSIKDAEKITAKAAMMAYDKTNKTLKEIAAGDDITELAKDENVKLYTKLADNTGSVNAVLDKAAILVHSDGVLNGVAKEYAKGNTITSVTNQITVSGTPAMAQPAADYTLYGEANLVKDANLDYSHEAYAEIADDATIGAKFDLKFEELGTDVETAKKIAEGQNALNDAIGNIKVTSDGTNIAFSHDFPADSKLDIDEKGVVSYDGTKIATITADKTGNNYTAGQAALSYTAGSDVDAVVDTKGDSTDYVFTINKGTTGGAKDLSFNLHVGADADMTNKISVDIEAMSAENLGIKGISVADSETDKIGMNATYAIDAIADAISKVSAQRSALGAIQNRLEHTIANVDNVVENTTAAESRIRDTDMAEEMVEYSKNNILAQAGQSMLAQANQANQGVLSLLG